MWRRIVGNRLRAGIAGGGVTPPAIAPIGTQVTFLADGTYSDTAAPGLRNIPTQTLFYLNGRLMPSPEWLAAASGGDMDTIFARIAPAIATKAGLAVFGSQGHNDALMTTDPDITPTILNKWKRNLDAWIAGNPFTTAAGTCYYIPVCATLPSSIAAETNPSSFNPAITIRQRVWDLEQAYVVGKGNARIFFVSFATYDPSVNASDAGNVHPNNAGGYAGGYTYLGPALDPLIATASKETILESLRLGTYPGLGASNLAPDVLMLGTAGTKSGTVTPTGNYATGQTITNSLTNGTAVSVVCSKDSSAVTYDKQIAVIGGTPASENTVLQGDSSNVALTGLVKGQYVLFSEEVIVDDSAGGAPAGLWDLALQGGSFGLMGSTTSSSSATGNPQAAPINTAVLTGPRAIFGAGTPTINASLTTRWGVFALGTDRTIISRPVIRVVSTPSQSAAYYVGGDGIFTGNYQLRNTGTISATTFGTVTVEPGQWAPYGLTFNGARIYKGGGSGGAFGITNIGAGTLIATLSAGTWTYATGVGDLLVPGDVLFSEVDGTGGVGSLATFRVNTGITVGA